MRETIIKIKIKHKYSHEKTDLSRITNLISLVWARKINKIENVSFVICWTTSIAKSITDERKSINAKIKIISKIEQICQIKFIKLKLTI